MILDILEIGHPTLRKVAREVDVDEIIGGHVQGFIDDLIDTKRHANGAGLASNQVDNLWRIFVVEVLDNPRYPYKPNYPLTVLVNPKIRFLTEERFDNYEGCLSIPNLRGIVERCPHIKVSGYNREGEAVEFEVKGVSAGTFQHELDHLDGVMFVDKLKSPRSLCTWSEFERRYQQPFGEQVEKIVETYGS